MLLSQIETAGVNILHRKNVIRRDSEGVRSVVGL